MSKKYDYDYDYEDSIRRNSSSNNYSRESLLQDIRELEFAAVELNLYLDNNPNDRRALAHYNRVSNVLLSLKERYEKKYGQLLHFGFSQNNDNCSWNWTKGPWPWE